MEQSDGLVLLEKRGALGMDLPVIAPQGVILEEDVVGRGEGRKIAG